MIADKLEAVFYGNVGEAYEIAHPKFFKLDHWKKGHEMKTLAKLYSFCKMNPRVKVIFKSPLLISTILHRIPSPQVMYFHTKGSFMAGKTNENFRTVLNAFTLHQGCLSALDNFDTCGWRLSPLPYIHYSGNFWWARCSYINTLIDPARMVSHSILQMQSLKEFPQLIFKTCMGLDRFFAETWIGTGVYVNGADCLDINVATNYLFGYGMDHSIRLRADEVLANPTNPVKCQAAAANRSSWIFQETFDREFHDFPCASTYNLTRRSLLWYGSPPYSLIQWRQQFGEYDTTTGRVQ